MINKCDILKIAAGTALAGALLSAGAAAAAETVKVGVLLSISGPAAPFGIPERDIIKILAEKYNAEGGINGHKLELIYHDDQSNPTEAARGATRLIRQDNVQVILGPSIGSSALAIGPIAAQAKVPILSPVSTQSVTNKDLSFFPWIFRTSTASAVTMQAMMDKVVFKPNVKKVAIMHQEDAYGKDEADLAQKMINAKGGIEIVAIASAPLSATDLTPAATRIRNANPDVVLLLTSAPAMGGAFARAAEQADLKAPILGSLSINQKPFLDAAGKASEGIMSVSLGNWFQPSERQKELGRLLQSAGKEPAGYAEIIGSTAIVALAEALRHIDGEVTGTKIRDAVENICDYMGTYADGQLCYSKDQHDAFGPETVNVVKVQDGKWKNIVLP
ncbi:ABC transporter substrate-binding protein [Xanthobacter wiegelii]|uniref:ABC transporter substrate-binding protein n=1 Tax=Xanthobacter wiegelii TaxID=3119913 RepID=UPI0037278EAE